MAILRRKSSLPTEIWGRIPTTRASHQLPPVSLFSNWSCARLWSLSLFLAK
jgi:hypothetical protein